MKAFGRIVWTMAVLIPAALLLFLFVAFIATAPAAAILLVPLGLYAWLPFIVIGQVERLEGRSGKDAVRRCWTLMSGHRMRVLGLMSGASAGVLLVLASAVLAAWLGLGFMVTDASALSSSASHSRTSRSCKRFSTSTSA